MTSDKLGVCVIGAGRAGMIHAVNFAKGVKNARLAAISDPNRAAAEEACHELELERHYPDYRQALENDEIDAIVVVTPTDYHRDIVVAAAEAGKHILCEKPMAMTVPECDEMIEAAEKNNVVLQIGFMRRFDQSFVYAREQVRQGVIGEVVLVKSLTRGPSIPQRWQYDIEKSNGPLAEVNSHDIDTLRWFTESEFEQVYAIAGNYRCPEARDEFPGFYDNVVMIGTFDNGMQGSIDGAVSVRYGYDARLEVVGTEGVLFVGRLDQSGVVTCNRSSGINAPAVESWRTLFSDAYRHEDQGFVDAILNGTPPAVSGHDGKMAVAVVNAGNRSIVEKRPIILNDD
ncbi:MAG: Gfo/Idh/MocA family oxidoreductase [Desulfobacterales bacterium]|jgi:myo-inositol 2-dehydrogenase/D-chiro-inositol 1-dehydrogenase/scyllo-inositol 2-dehydrogenase (NAD+)